MRLVTVVVFTIGLTTAYASNCADISGKWQNELGSQMVLQVDNSNGISGEYSTAVETKPGAAAFVSNITGLYSKQSDGSILAFSVFFNHGSSLATWVGQCITCDEKEVLHTTYTLRRYVADPLEKWTAVIVNQNTFWRVKDKRENEVEDSLPTRSPVVRSFTSEKYSDGLELAGKWQSNDQEEIEIFGLNEGVLQGRRTCCLQAGKLQGKHSTDLIGSTDGNEIFTAVTLMSVSGKKIRSSTGHIYDKLSSNPKILETSWLEHEFNPSCISPRNMVRYGVQNFTRTSAGFENMVNKSETFLDKIRKFFTSMF